MKSREITVRSAGTPDIILAADLFAPLFLKIYERNQSKRPALCVVSQIEQGSARFVNIGTASGIAIAAEIPT